MGGSATGEREQRRLQQYRAHSARMNDYYLGGSTNYVVDRAAADQVIREVLSIGLVAGMNRAFMQRGTRLLAQRGVRSYLDIGSGLPFSPNLHEVAQGIVPQARVVYVDSDPLVLTYLDALVDGTPQGETHWVEADVTDTVTLLRRPAISRLLSHGEPVALSMTFLLHFLGDRRDPYEVVGELVEALPSGSYLLLSHLTADFSPEAWHAVEGVYRESGTYLEMRDRAAVTRFFDGMELEHPGVVVGHRWHAEADDPLSERLHDADVSLYVGLGRKP